MGSPERTNLFRVNEGKERICHASRMAQAKVQMQEHQSPKKEMVKRLPGLEAVGVNTGAGQMKSGWEGC